MAHGTAYTWGLSATENSNGTTLGSLENDLRSGKNIGTATLTITGLYDWTTEPADVLYVNLLNNVKPGNSSYTYDPSPASSDKVFGKDIFVAVPKPTAPIAPIVPTKPTLKLPTAPKSSTLKAPTPPAALSAHPTASQEKAYNTALAAYNTKLTAYNAAQTAYATALAAYNSDLAAYNAAQADYAAAKTAYTAALAIYNTDLAAYNTALVAYNDYTKTQAALGFTGVSPTLIPGLYDQANSLLISHSPNGPGTWTDLDGPTTTNDLTITLSSANISLLAFLLENNSPTTDLGFGFGPDCHFYDTKITFNVTTVPDEGTTLSLLGLALVGLVGMRRFVKRPVRS